MMFHWVELVMRDSNNEIKWKWTGLAERKLLKVLDALNAQWCTWVGVE